MVEADTGREHISPPFFFKARPHEEAGERFLFLEAANEKTDLQQEKILQEALWASRDYYLAKGNLDIDHISKIGLRLSPPVRDYYNYEVGRPVDVGRSGGATFVKGLLRKGNQHADGVWHGLTVQQPAAVWYGSVAGAILAREQRGGVSVISECRWNNTALTQEPVNHTLMAAASTTPIGPFAKALEAVSSDAFAKALMAGPPVTDSAQLTGGAALRRESLHGKHMDPYRRFKGHASKRILSKGVLPPPTEMVELARECGVEEEDAPEFAQRFYKELLADVRATKEARP